MLLELTFFIQELYVLDFLWVFFFALPCLFFFDKTQIKEISTLNYLVAILALTDDDDEDNSFSFFSALESLDEEIMLPDTFSWLFQVLPDDSDSENIFNDQFTSFFSLNYFSSLDLFEEIILALLLVVFFYFATENIEAESDLVLNFLQTGLAFLPLADDLFVVFLILEFLTIGFVVLILLNQERYNFNKSLIFYYILSVVLSLVVFFFIFFIILLLTGTELFVIFNFSDFFLNIISLVLEFQSEIDYALPSFSILLNFFFLMFLILFFFKFTLGPVALWTIFIYPNFSLLLIILQLINLKFGIFFLFLEFFEFFFFFIPATIQFVNFVFSFTLVLAMFFGCFAYKINDLKTLFIITSFSQIGYISLTFLSPSLTLLIYTINYLQLYIYSTLVLFLIFFYINIQYKIQYVHQLFLLRFLDPGLFFAFLSLIFSMAGLPPFLGFFTKYMILIKVLIDPLLFKLGVVLLVTSFITMYIYLNVVYSLLKPNKLIFNNNEFNLFTAGNSLTGGIKIFFEILSFFITGIICGFSMFLVSPLICMFIFDVEEFEEFYNDWLFLGFSDLIESHFLELEDESDED